MSLIENSDTSITSRTGIEPAAKAALKKPTHTPKPELKQKPNTPKSSDSTVTLEFFVATLFNKANSVPSIEKLNIPDRATATMLLSVLDNVRFRPDTLGNFKTLTESTQLKLVKKSENFYFLTRIFFEMHAYPIALSALRKIINHFDRAPEFLLSLESQVKKPHFQEMLMKIGDYVTLNTDEFKLLRWTLLSHATPRTLTQFQQLAYWSTLKGKSEEFFELPATLRSHILRKLDKQPFDFLNFLATLQVQKSSKMHLAFLTPQLMAISVSDLLSIAIAKPNLASRDLLEILFKESLQKKLTSISNIESCLPYFSLESLLPGFFESDEISRAWKRSNHRTTGLILNFRSDELGKLNQEIEKLRTDNQTQSHENQELTSIAAAREIEISKLGKLLENYENRLKERVQAEIFGQGAIERQIYIDIYRKLVELLDVEIARSKSESLLMLLAKMGISRIGLPGEVIEWRADICNPVNGMEIANPVVIRPGYIWNSGAEQIVLVKALVKP